MAAFRVGDRVRVRTNDPPTHMRTPAFLRGKVGVIERDQGPFGRPEDLAYGRAPRVGTVYRVRFRQREVWPDYRGGPRDTVAADLFEHWLDREAS